ncbi:MAG: endonuclease/exonuclease/phosphatase family protein, partial [Flavobacteriales bacterium]|nr:endonuclease/exonuclease/phosphatase family protein [Flavobacteriales bacterium]
MNKYLLSAVLIVFAGITIYTTMQTEFDESGQLDVVFYNVENLFDTENDPLTFDDAFTPDSTKHWTKERYQKKLADLVKVISKVPKSGLPEAIGLCEVENRKVVEDLIRTDTLQKRKYLVIHEESPDKRGIDVAFIYDELVMKELHHEAIRYGFSFEPETTTRDILYAKMLAKKDTLHFFINHWSSRRGGMEKSEPKRMKAATV